jgi:HEPN domain-containing protein
MIDQRVKKWIIKAYLTLKGRDFGKTHNLEFLLRLCSEEDKDFDKLNVGDLTFYAVDVRYPDEFYTPSLEEAKEAFEIAKQVKDFIFKKLNITERDIL